MTTDDDLSKARETRELKGVAQRLEGELDAMTERIDQAFGTMLNEHFARYVQFVEAQLPLGSVLTEGWFQSHLTSFIGLVVKEIPPEIAHAWFKLLLEWMYATHIQQFGSLPNYRRDRSKDPDRLQDALAVLARIAAGQVADPAHFAAQALVVLTPAS